MKIDTNTTAQEVKDRTMSTLLLMCDKSEEQNFDNAGTIVNKWENSLDSFMMFYGMMVKENGNMPEVSEESRRILAKGLIR